MAFLSMLFASPPAPVSTSSCLLDLPSKVYVITNASSPCNISLARTLYNLHATVYVGRSSCDTINTLQASCPDSKGHLKPFVYDPSDLASVNLAVDNFLENKWRLDVLFLDCGSDFLPSFVLARLLTPMLRTTASHFAILIHQSRSYGSPKKTQHKPAAINFTSLRMSSRGVGRVIRWVIRIRTRYQTAIPRACSMFSWISVDKAQISTAPLADSCLSARNARSMMHVRSCMLDWLPE